MGLADWLKRKKPQTVWTIKQIDEDLLHLCGKATIESEAGAAKLNQALRQGEFSGPVRMLGNDTILNSTQFAALIPEPDLDLLDDHHAKWRNQHWRLSWVPQRCWLHDGRLASQPNDLPGRPYLVSLEDTSDILSKAIAPQAKDNPVSLEPKESAAHWQLIDKNDYRP